MTVFCQPACWGGYIFNEVGATAALSAGEKVAELRVSAIRSFSD